MANGRNKVGKAQSFRDGHAFMAIPWVVVDSPAYQKISHPAKSLLFEIARQYKRDNNGQLLCSMNFLRKRGWNSSAVVTRAKKALIAVGLIHETVMGHRPNKASWYAITWCPLDKNPDYDEGAAATFVRSAYSKPQAA